MQFDDGSFHHATLPFQKRSPHDRPRPENDGAHSGAASACSAAAGRGPSVSCRTSQVTANAPAPTNPTIAQVLSLR